MILRSKKQLSDKELAEELHSAGLDAWEDYERKGKSADEWNKFRLKIATELNERLVIKKC